MSRYLVSVLVPVYKVEKYIERCARSIFEQTYENLEIIFVDDCSPDASIDILNSVIREYPYRREQVRLIYNDCNKGPSAVRNILVHECRGEFLVYVDSDDWLEWNAIELLVKKQEETGADIITAQAYCHKDGMKTPYTNGGWNMDKKTLLVELLTYKVSTSLWRRLIRKKLYTDHHIVCDEHACAEDFQTLPRLVYYATKVSGIEDYVYHYDRTNENSIMNNCLANVNTQLEGLVAVQHIVSFFSNKEDFLSDITNGMDIRNMYYRLAQNAVHGNKEGYTIFKQLILNSDRNYWYQIRWDNKLVRCLESNYHSFRLFRLLISWHNRICLKVMNLLK